MSNNGQEIYPGEPRSPDNGTPVARPDFLKTSVLAGTGMVVLGRLAAGEVSHVGIAAAVANAVFHATGKRIRRLPITLDKLM